STSGQRCAIRMATASSDAVSVSINIFRIGALVIGVLRPREGRHMDRDSIEAVGNLQTGGHDMSCPYTDFDLVADNHRTPRDFSIICQNRARSTPLTTVTCGLPFQSTIVCPRVRR